VLYLGEINNSQEAAWRKSLQVFDEVEQRYSTLSLFPDDRPVPAEAIGSIQVKPAFIALIRSGSMQTGTWIYGTRSSGSRWSSLATGGREWSRNCGGEAGW
jgi:hypothetical protein